MASAPRMSCNHFIIEFLAIFLELHQDLFLLACRIKRLIIGLGSIMIAVKPVSLILSSAFL